MTLWDDFKAWFSGKRSQDTKSSAGEPDATASPSSPKRTTPPQSPPKESNQLTDKRQHEYIASLQAKTLSNTLFRTTLSGLLSQKLAAISVRIIKASASLVSFWKNRLNPAVIAASFLPVIFPVLIFGPILNFSGFGAGGVIAGSLAVFIQSCIDKVAAGSLFAILQSAAMSGFGLAIVAGVAQGAALSVAGLVALRAYLRS